MIAILRETGHNRYSVNALAAILEACAVPWVAAPSAAAAVQAARTAAARGAPALVLYSFLTPELPAVRAEVRDLVRRAPGAVAVAGGAHATADPEGTLALGFRHVCAGAAEVTLPGLLADPGSAAEVLDGGPLPGDGLERFSPFPRERPGPVELTRGCPHGCGFCAVGRRRPVHRSRDAVLTAAARLRATGRRKVFFVTPDALGYGAGLDELGELLVALRGAGMAPVLGTFPSEVRPERVTPEAVALLARHCDNRSLVIGAQSGSDHVLRRLRRGHGVDAAVAAARAAREGGFLPHVDLIFGVPGEAPADQEATVQLARRLRRESDAKIHAHYYHPLPGTPLWGQPPAPLGTSARRFLTELRRGGGEDGDWQVQERWSHHVLEWAERGWIRTPAVGGP